MRSTAGFDFSLNKPAFVLWDSVTDSMEIHAVPADLSLSDYRILTAHGVSVVNRNLPSIKSLDLDESALIMEHVRRATQLSDIISDILYKWCIENGIRLSDVVIANEGFAFSAKGDATLDLSGYKYILMKKLIDTGFTNFRTYSPITIKKTAGCSKKGMGKTDMIEALRNSGCESEFVTALHENPSLFIKKKNYMPLIDDIADAYWCLRTCMADVFGAA